ncbi:multidrug resistance protein MDR [Ascobolus immersus RN42]|uniref:Multidrug resistance protein MDR n=1 Tax=Ascobolus immersus RN42 TaxID=1160509 RepID=A0A3N4IP04_ASCIM|nr:multidrug resistance protein MDR [Ascobolus immersus RN42]
MSDEKGASPPSRGGSLNEKAAVEGNNTVVDVPKANAGGKEGDDQVDIETALSKLPPDEAEILRAQLQIPDNPISYFTLYRFMDKNDAIILVLSAIAAIGSGAVMPLMTVIFGDLTGTFGGLFMGTVSKEDFMDEVGSLAIQFIYLFIGLFIGTYGLNTGFTHSGETLTAKIRVAYMKSIMRQNTGYYDRIGAGEIAVRITSDTALVQTALSEKVGMSLMSVAMFISAFVIGFTKCWKLTFILCSTVVALCIVIGGGSAFVIKYFRLNLQATGNGGTVAEEVFSSVRNCIAFGTEEKLAENYAVHLRAAEKWGRQTKIGTGFIIGGMMGVIYLNLGLAFWQGAMFVIRGDAEVSDVITTLLALMIGAFALAGVGPNITHIQNGVAAGSKIFSTIDRVSPIDPSDPSGQKLENVQGEITIKNIKFIYPSRPDVLVLPDFSLNIPAGKVTALVGPSGSGKSTIVGLVERFYDPVGGQVLLDGVSLRDLNLRWLRQNVALVSQEPTLFSVSIFENVAHGLIGTPHEFAAEEKKRELVVAACETANADAFIRELPEGYDTNVGQRGFLLSGGQKQRIAIARAIVGDPKILLLDEATSALDTKSEGIVQDALDRAAMSRTTIVIAHRLSTIRNADNIVVMNKGHIVEQGTHEQLMALQGEYAGLVEAQRIGKKLSAANDIDGYSTNSETEVEETGPDLEEQARIVAAEERAGAMSRKLSRTTTGHSVSSKVLRDQQAEEKPKHSIMSLCKMIYGLSRPEKWSLLAGSLLAILMGGGSPVQGVFFAKSVGALSLPPNMYDQMKKDASFWSLMFLMLGLVQFLVTSLSSTIFGLSAERLIFRVRDISFRTLLRQEMGYFDREENSTGEITSFLSTEANDIASMSGATLATILSGITTLVASVVISVVMSWKIGLVCTATIPLIISSGFLRMYLLRTAEANRAKTLAGAASFATECTAAIKTVTSLTRDEEICKAYHDILHKQTRKNLLSTLRTSALYAWAESITILMVALGFWYGGKLMSEGQINVEKFFISFTVILFGAQSAGQVFAFASDIGKARNSAEKVKTLVDRQPAIDVWSTEGQKPETITGEVEFRDVHFRYPTRPHVPVLRGLNLKVQPGQYIALVGQSGCGKSTTIGLVERFYDALHGQVLIDGVPITDYNLREIRKHIALVQQEPTLYQGTVRENVLLGTAGDDSTVSDEEIIQACKDANIHDFILSLPEGYNTQVGNKGGMLSGGQKQRIAIARALIRKPKILLLDEATSALDSESEKVVQAALDKAAHGRTTIAIAHRLSTIQKADQIYLFEAGRVAEQGTHDELMALGGRYADLVKLQALEEV